MLRCFVFMGKSWIFVEDSFVFHENEPSQALRARFPLLSPAVTSSPGAGEVFPRRESFIAADG